MKITGFRAFSASLVLVAGLSVGSGPAAAEPLDALKDQTMRLVIAAGAGGGSDRMGRMLAAAFERALPETTVHVQNKGGAGGGLALAEVQTSDGKLITLGFSNNGPVYIQLSGVQGDQFDLSRLAWIGAVSDNQRVVLMRKDLGPPTLDTLMSLGRQPIIAVSGSAGSASYTEAMLLNAMLPLKMKVAADIDQPVAQSLLLAGDVDLALGSYGSLKPMLDTGEVVPVLLFDKNGAPDEVAGTPDLADVITDPRHADMVGMMQTLSRSGRLIVASPSTPPEVVAALRAAFDIATADPEYEAAMTARSYVVNATAGETMEARVGRLLGDGAVIEQFRALEACGERISDGATTSCE